MDNHVYKILELTGTSTKSIEDAVNAAVTRAAKTVRNMKWFEVLDTRGGIEGGKIKEWQVSVKIGFSLDEPKA